MPCMTPKLGPRHCSNPGGNRGDKDATLLRDRLAMLVANDRSRDVDATNQDACKRCVQAFSNRSSSQCPPSAKALSE
jgi:hypothetical protein